MTTLAEKVLARHKTAGEFPPKMPPPPPDNGAGPKRNIPKDHPFDPKQLKPLAKSLFAASVALGHCLTAYRHLSRVKSASVSPDGLLGGQGYVMGVRDMRKKIHEACEALANITDTLHDEIAAPHWKPRLAQLDENTQEDIGRFVEEAESRIENPGDKAEEEIENIEKENDGPGGTPKDDAGSKMPDSGEGSETPDTVTPDLDGIRKEARLNGVDRSRLASSLQEISKWANSSIPGIGETSVPRVDSLEPEGGNGPFGSFNEDEGVQDNWGEEEGTRFQEDYDYPGEQENDMMARVAMTRRGPVLAVESLPDSSTDDTPTDAWDFGIGMGARGDGAGGYANPGPGGAMVEGPASGIPGAPPTVVEDKTTPVVEKALNERQSDAVLPGDESPPVARTDYYPGNRGNDVNISQSEMPGAPAPFVEDAGSSEMVNTFKFYEDVSTPYVRYDYTTHQQRQDPLDDSPEKDTTNE